MKKKKLKKAIRVYKAVIFGTAKKYGMVNCYDTAYKGCWDKELALAKRLSKENKKVKSISYTGKELHDVPLGVYKIFWKSGGSSLASIGNLHDGVRWIAPINWTAKDSPTGRMDKHAGSIEKMILLSKD